jgi:acyl carrier protein
MSAVSHSLDAAGVQQWLVERVGHYLNRPAADVDPNLPLAEMGLDSVYALGLCGDIEDGFDLSVDPTLAWDYPTITAISEFVADKIASPGADDS